MHLGARSFAFVTVLLLGCSSGSADPTVRDTITLVGRVSQGPGPSVNTLAGLVIEGDYGRFFACGDELTETTTIWVDLHGIARDRPNAELKTTGSSGWQLKGSLTPEGASGSVEKGGDRFVWSMTTVDTDGPGRPGVYEAGDGCLTGVVVPEEGEPQGSYCTGPTAAAPNTATMRAQVTPLYPVEGGFLVELDDLDVEEVVPRARPSLRH